MMKMTATEHVQLYALVHEIETEAAWQGSLWSWCHGLFTRKELDEEPKPVTCLWCVARVRPAP